MLSFIFGMCGGILVLYSIYRMKEVLGYKNKNRFRQIIASQNESKVIILFFKSMIKNEEQKLSGTYLSIAFYFVIGTITILGAILFGIMTSL